MHVKPMTADEGTDHTRTFDHLNLCTEIFFPKFLVLISFHTNQRLWKLLLIKTGTTLQNFRQKTTLKVMAFTYCVVRNKRRSFLLISLFTMNCISCRSRNSRCHSSIKVSTCDRIGAASNNMTYVIITEHQQLKSNEHSPCNKD